MLQHPLLIYNTTLYTSKAPVTAFEAILPCATLFYTVFEAPPTAQDFAFEADGARMRKAAHLMVTSLAGSMALVSCRDAMRTSLSGQLRALLADSAGAGTIEEEVRPPLLDSRRRQQPLYVHSLVAMVLTCNTKVHLQC